MIKIKFDKENNKSMVECIIENAQKQNKTLIADCSYAQKVIEKK